MKAFDFVRPNSLSEAVTALGREGARALAGGTDLIPQLREGRRTASTVVDLKRIPDLTAIARLASGHLRIGAAASASSVADHPIVARDYPSIAAAVRLIGCLQVQNRASLGGNICNAAPSADVVPVLMCHDAMVEIAGSKGVREAPLESLFAGPGRTTLERSEILVSIRLPPVDPRAAADYRRFTPRREMDIAIAGVASRVVLAPSGHVASARIVLASVAPTPLRAPTAEQSLIGTLPSRAVIRETARCAATDSRPISDTRGSADYRRHLVEVLTARALMQCLLTLGVEISQT